MPVQRSEAKGRGLQFSEYKRGRESFLFQTYHANSNVILGESGLDLHTDAPLVDRLYGEQMAPLNMFYQTTEPSAAFIASEVIPLPRGAVSTPLSFESIVRERRSLRRPIPYEMPLSELSYIASQSFALVEGANIPQGQLPARVVPSAGALYPLEVFLLPLNVEGLELDVFQYRTLNHTLARLRVNPKIEEVYNFVHNVAVPLQSSLLVLVTAFFSRSSYKYGERSYRYIMAEAGALLEHVALAAEALGLRSAMIGGYCDSIANNWVGVDGVDAGVVMCAAVGKETPPASNPSADGNAQQPQTQWAGNDASMESPTNGA